MISAAYMQEAYGYYCNGEKLTIDDIRVSKRLHVAIL